LSLLRTSEGHEPTTSHTDPKLRHKCVGYIVLCIMFPTLLLISVLSLHGDLTPPLLVKIAFVEKVPYLALVIVALMLFGWPFYFFLRVALHLLRRTDWQSFAVFGAILGGGLAFSQDYYWWVVLEFALVGAMSFMGAFQTERYLADRLLRMASPNRAVENE
jgi:hypothetical protein